MKLGTHVHYTKTSKFSYSAKPDFAWGGCGAHFTKWPLSQKLRGAEPSTLTQYRFCEAWISKKKYCQHIMYHTTLSDIVKAILQNGGHFQSNTSISETKRRRAEFYLRIFFTGMDKTCVYTSFYGFICVSGRDGMCPG